MSEIFGFDAFSPKEIAVHVETIGVAIVFPISAFVAAGFEHSIANMYFIPLAMLLQTFDHVGGNAPMITWAGFFSNLVPVILGNIIGGSVLVGLVYHVIYRRTPGL